MKFDLIIGNPPYDKSLHLKILKKAMEYCDFDSEGEIVWLHPSNWLASITADKKKYGWLDGKILSIDTFPSDAFEIRIPGGLEIMCLGKNGKNVNEVNSFEIRRIPNAKTVFDVYVKIQNKIPLSLHSKLKFPDTDMKNWNVYICLMVGTDKNGNPLYEWALNGTGRYHYGIYHNDVFEDKKTFLERCKNQYKKKSCTRVEFDERRYAENFIKSLNCRIYRFLNFLTMVDVHVHPKQLPWMGEAVNPRTGLKGYEGEWTDEDFFEYFGLTEEERNIVRSTSWAKQES